jgi:hypothetical protein
MNVTKVFTGRSFGAKIMDKGEVTQETFCMDNKRFLRFALRAAGEVIPAIMAMAVVKTRNRVK